MVAGSFHLACMNPLLYLLQNWGLPRLLHCRWGHVCELWLQVHTWEELGFWILSQCWDGSGLLDRWPIALKLSECTYVNSDREVQLWPELGKPSKCRAIRHCGWFHKIRHEGFDWGCSFSSLKFGNTGVPIYTWLNEHRDHCSCRDSESAGI